MAQFDDLINQLYQEQLGRAPDASGAEYYASQLAAGVSPQQIAADINRSREGVEFDTQTIESAYRQNLGRTAESPGAQYWLSSAQSTPLTNEQLRQAIASAAASKEQVERGIVGKTFTELELADLVADPFGGRRPINNIYDVPANEADRINISYINGIPVQFVNPLTEASYISRFGEGEYNAAIGDDLLIPERLDNTLRRAFEAGSLTQEEFTNIARGLSKPGITAQEVRDVLGIPKGAVIIDPTYGQQIGEDNALRIAQAEAAQRQAVLSAQDPGYYQANDVLGQAYLDAGLDFPFMLSNYPERTMATQADRFSIENLNKALSMMNQTATQKFGGLTDLQTPLTGQYYSEAGLQAGYTPVGTEGTTFRSGVAGYVPQAQLPTGFNFGAPPVNATFQQYRPGAFQPSGVTTGGYITGYNTNGTPIYSTYADPNQTVGNYVAPQTTQSYTTELVNQILASNPGLNFANQLASQQSTNNSAGG